MSNFRAFKLLNYILEFKFQLICDQMLVLFVCLFTVERQISAIRAIRDVETEHLLTNLRLLRSYFNKEQQRTPVLQYFKENFQNLSNVRNGENGQMEVQWIDKDGNVSMNDGMDLHETLLRRLSIAYSGCSAAIPSLGGFEFSSKAGINNFRNSYFLDMGIWNLMNEFVPLFVCVFFISHMIELVGGR